MIFAVNYGAGTNSTALLVGLHQRGRRPDAIVFSDTGGERPETYEYIEAMAPWLSSVGFPPITTVRWIRRTGDLAGSFVSLEQSCLDRRELPSLAYGFKGCSVKWKAQPVERWLSKEWPAGREEIAAGRPLERALGMGADERHRARESRRPELWTFTYPLIDWMWGREECVQAIDRAGLPQPGKSSCFFCPSMRPSEIAALGVSHPELVERGLQIEANAKLDRTDSIKGLGRSFSWKAVWDQHRRQLPLFPAAELPCDCFDGDDEE